MAEDTGHPDSRRVVYRRLRLDTGTHAGTSVGPTGLRLATPAGERDYADPYASPSIAHRFAEASWTSPAIEPGFAFTELVPTWHATTPGGSWLEVAARAQSIDTERWTDWYVLARWADHDEHIHPTSVPSTTDVGAETAKVATDTLVVPAGARAWQLRTTLLRPAGQLRATPPRPAPDDAGAGMIASLVPHGDAGQPVLSYAGVMVSAAGMSSVPRTHPALTDRPTTEHVLAVPALSQRIHAGHHPEWGGGGDAWCSPTSVTMVLRFWGVGPDRTVLGWVDQDYPDRAVYHAVRHCFDYAYAGAGNWSFNVAYAARFGLSAFVTRLRGLDEAATFLRAGIPLVAAVRVDPAQLTGADYTSGGHLLVMVGLTEAGDVVVNDPGGRDPATIRRTYRRNEFERAWFTGNGGLVYVIHPPEVPLPPHPTEANW